MTTSSIGRRSALSLLVSLSVITAACAQTPAASTFEPRHGQAGKDVIWIPTPDSVVDRMLQMAEVKATDRVVDLGSGDGKIAIAAGKSYGARARGLEYNPNMVELSIRRAREAGVADKVSFEQADIFVSDFSTATVVTMYLLPELNLRLRPILFRMPPGTRVVSHSFTMGDWKPDEVSRSGGEAFLWRIPANAGGSWRFTASGLSNLPQTLNFTQTFQNLEGEAGFGTLTASLVRPHLSGDALTFQVRDSTGGMLRFAGRVAGDRITGTVARDGQTPVSFEAVRTSGAPPSIIGVVADKQEKGSGSNSPA